MHKLIELVEMEVDEHLEGIDACELGEVVDVIKDLSEVLYYCAITEAMEEKDAREIPPHHPAEVPKKV
jgi:hypothetical protein